MTGRTAGYPAYGRFLILLVAAGLLTRFQQFGNPIVHIDEQFYALVGERMLSGSLPYVDIWDRKPIGLFLLYAAIRVLGGSGIVAYQLVATGFAIGTAILVERLSSRIAGPRGAMLSALLYLCWIPLLTGQGGQSPVFYNLFVAGAALAVCRGGEGERSPAGLFALGGVAMLSTGIALQIKYSVVFEGGLFGLVLIWIAVRKGVSPPIVVAMAAGWITLALLPTAAAALVYWWLGHLGDFWFANFVSIFLRHPMSETDTLRNAGTLFLYLLPLMVAAIAGARSRIAQRRDFASGFLGMWLAAAVLSVVVFGYYFDHYGLPIVAPAAVSAATMLDRRRRPDWPVAILVGALVACLILPTFNQRRRGTPAQFARLERIVQPYAARGLLVWDDYPALYDVLRAPLPTRYPFPTHLRDANERGAVGVDQRRELARILDGHPAAIVVEDNPRAAQGEPTTAQLMTRVRAGYRQIAAVRVGRHDQIVYLDDGIALAAVAP